jgi:hypothetical protein
MGHDISRKTNKILRSLRLSQNDIFAAREHKKTQGENSLGFLPLSPGVMEGRLKIVGRRVFCFRFTHAAAAFTGKQIIEATRR